MIMSEFEILRDYHQAKNKIEQVKILADLNGCTKKEITAFLEKRGVTVLKVDTPEEKRQSISYLHGEEMTDEEIATLIGLRASSVGVIRAQLGLKKHKKKRKPVGADFLLKT